MPAFDQCHEQVVHALEKEGWRIETQHVRLAAGRRRAFVDLRATRQVNGHRQQIMLVEVKCFSERNDASQELYTAIGQYLIYRAMLAEVDDATSLYLSVPDEIFATVFDSAARRVIQESQIKLVIVSLATERVVQWIE
jgi:glucose-6-phosphate 1-dehydrogenase